jgi:hypothetical protein
MKKYIYAALFVALSHAGFSQVDNSMFFLSRLPQANLINPAQTPECGIFISGAAVPFFGQLPPAMTFAVNTPLDWNDIIFKGKGEYKDSLISFMHPSYNVDDFTKKLGENNTIAFNYELPILYLGFRQAKNYWTFDVTTRINTYVNIPGDLLKFAIHGNGSTPSVDISGLSANAMVYHQVAVGFQRQLPLDFAMSARAKFLLGHANISSTKNNLQIITADGTNFISLMANYEISTNMPLNVEYTEDGKVDMDKLNVDFDNIGVSDFLGNYGGAIDLGVSKKFNPGISVFASVIDLGFINWQTNANTISLSGEDFTFEGAEITVNPFKAKFPDFDSLFNTYSIEHSTDSYITMLPFRIYAGGHYQLNKTFGFGLLGRLEKRPFGVSPSFTASVDVRPFKFGNAALTYSYMNRNFTNIGIGYTLRIGPVQWYFVSDNLIGSLLFPSNSRSISARFGCNLVFKRTDGVEKTKKPKKLKHQTKMQNL